MKKIDVQLTLRKLEIKPKKRLGQNFLIDNNIAQKILNYQNYFKKSIIKRFFSMSHNVSEYAKSRFPIIILL